MMSRKLFVVVVLVFVLMPRTALAYVDPSVGGYLFQILAATAVFFLVTLRLIWSQLIKWIRQQIGQSDERNR